MSIHENSYISIDKSIAQQVDYPYPTPKLTFDFPPHVIETCMVHGRPWVHRGETLARFANEFDLRVIVELGVWRGETFERLLEQCPAAKVYGVDRWAPAPEAAAGAPEDWAEWPHEDHLARVQAIASGHPGRAHVFRMETVTAAAFFNTRSVDMVFVDADHSYNGVISDIDAWLPKIRSGGWIVGHDIDWTTVRAAVHDRIGYDLEYGMDALWAWQVP